MGNGVQKNLNASSKRIKSSKLAPIKEDSARKTPSSTFRRPSGEKSNSVANINNQLNMTG